MIDDLIQWLNEFMTAERMSSVLRAAAIIALGLLAARYGGRGLGGLVARRGGDAPAALVKRVTQWGVFLLALMWAMQELGFNLGVLLGAAGVATVAIGFASQTSLSNLISGFFLFGEAPFKIGDVIEVEGVTGEVLAVDLFSTKLRTFTNHYVRIPNESMFKQRLTNLTRFPIRRLDLSIPVSHEEDLDRVRQLLFDVAEENAHCLAEPAPLFFLTRFDESSVVAQLSVWGPTTEWLAFGAAMTRDITEAFRREKIILPYPRRVLHQAGDAARL